MFRALLLAISALGLTWIVSSSIAAPASGQFGPPAHYGGCHWPPHPADMVCLDGNALYSGFGTIVPIYNVPCDKWFVITDMDLLPYLSATWPAPDCAIYENLGGGTRTLKMSGLLPDQFFPAAADYTGYITMGGYQPTIGLAFAPGSIVELQNSSGGNPGTFYHITGYLVDA